MRIATTIGLVFFLLGFAAPAMSQPASDLLIVPGTGIGPITLGQPVSLIIGVLGPPRFTYNPGNGFTAYAWFDNTLGGPGHQAGRGLAASRTPQPLLSKSKRTMIPVTGPQMGCVWV